MNDPVTLWIDAQLSPTLAAWMEAEFDVSARSLKRLGLRDADTSHAAREADVIVLTKDADFERMLGQHGPPPRVIWLTFGNTSNARVREVLRSTLLAALDLLHSGESLVEIREATTPRTPG